MRHISAIGMIILLWAVMLALLSYSMAPKNAPAKNCALNRAYWDWAGDQTNLVLESENCTGGTVLFMIYENTAEKRFAGNLSARITSNNMKIPWNPEASGGRTDIGYMFDVYINPP